MDYKDFCREIIPWMKQNSGMDPEETTYFFYPNGFLPDPYDRHALMFVRDTNRKYSKVETRRLNGDFLELRSGKLSFRFEVKYMYEAFCRSGWDGVREIVRENLNYRHEVEENEILRYLEDYEALKEHLIIKPMNWPDNQHILGDNIVRRIDEIALVVNITFSYKELLGKEAGTEDSWYFRVTRTLLDRWGISEDELWEQAMLSTQLMAPPRLYLHAREVDNPSYARGAFLALGSTMKLRGGDVPTLTTTQQLYGAVAIFYPGAARRISQMWGGAGFYIAFTGVDECRLHKEGMVEIDSIKYILSLINRRWASTRLTGKVYRYDPYKDMISVIE